MERHQHVVVQILSQLGQVWVYASHTPELLITSMMVFGRERPTFGNKRYPLPHIALKFFSRVNMEQQDCRVNFCDFSGFIWTFYTLTGFYRHFMCIIQI